MATVKRWPPAGMPAPQASQSRTLASSPSCSATVIAAARAAQVLDDVGASLRPAAGSSSTGGGPHMRSQPGKQLITPALARRDPQNEPFLVVNARVYLESVQDEERLHERVTGPLVPVDEGMILDDRVPERRGLLDERRVEILSAECH